MKHLSRLWALIVGFIVAPFSSAPETRNPHLVSDGDFRVRNAMVESKATTFRRVCASRRRRKSKPVERRRKSGPTPERHDGFTLGLRGRRYGATR